MGVTMGVAMGMLGQSRLPISKYLHLDVLGHPPHEHDGHHDVHGHHGVRGHHDHGEDQEHPRDSGLTGGPFGINFGGKTAKTRTILSSRMRCVHFSVKAGPFPTPLII